MTRLSANVIVRNPVSVIALAKEAARKDPYASRVRVLTNAYIKGYRAGWTVGKRDARLGAPKLSHAERARAYAFSQHFNDYPKEFAFAEGWYAGRAKAFRTSSWRIV